MAKELTREQIVKKQYSNLQALNQRLKNISEAYYICPDGTVYIKSLVPFVEKFIRLYQPKDIEIFQNMLIMPNELFEFTKSAKKTHLTIFEGNDHISFSQDNNENLSIKLNKMSDDETSNLNNVIPSMYKRFFYMNTPEYIQYEDKGAFIELSEKDVDDIINSHPVYYNYNETELIFTKHLFLDIKKGDRISLSRQCYIPLNNNNIRAFYMMKHMTELYDCYTLFNTLQNGKGL